jgi:hypothetical protein
MDDSDDPRMTHIADTTGTPFQAVRPALNPADVTGTTDICERTGRGDAKDAKSNVESESANGRMELVERIRTAGRAAVARDRTAAPLFPDKHTARSDL